MFITETGGGFRFVVNGQDRGSFVFGGFVRDEKVACRFLSRGPEKTNLVPGEALEFDGLEGFDLRLGDEFGPFAHQSVPGL